MGPPRSSCTTSFEHLRSPCIFSPIKRKREREGFYFLFFGRIIAHWELGRGGGKVLLSTRGVVVCVCVCDVCVREGGRVFITRKENVVEERERRERERGGCLHHKLQCLQFHIYTCFGIAGEPAFPYTPTRPLFLC